MGFGREHTEEELALAEKFPWIDPVKRQGPTCGDRDLLDGLFKDPGYVAVRTYATHKSIKIFTPIHSQHLEHTEGCDWELFSLCYRGSVDGVDYVWGEYVEGMGAFHVMVPAQFTRELTAAEREAWSGQTMGMYGSHSGKLSYSFRMPQL